MVFSSDNKKGYLSQEHQQYWIRLTLSLFMLFVLYWQNSSKFLLSISNPIILIITGYALLTTTTFFLIKKKALTKRQNQYLSIVIDTVSISLLLIFGGELTSAVCTAYYLVVIHNGVNAKNRELLASTLISISGFATVLYLSSYWGSLTALGIGLMVGLLLISLILYKKNDATYLNNKTEIAGDSNKKDAPKGLKLLFITNDLQDRHMLLSYIDSWGINADIYNSSLRAFADLVYSAESGQGYTTVIIDSLNLDMDPIQFAKYVLSDSALSNIHLIHLSPEHSVEQKEKLLNAGYTTLLKTPIDKTILFDALHNSKPHTTSGENITQLINHYSSKTNHKQPLDILLAVHKQVEQEFFRTTLEHNGQRVYTVNTGSQTLDALNTHQFDLVVLDFKMPDIEGKEIIRLYYYAYLNEDWVPFIALVDEATPEILSQCRESEVNAILVRPVEKEELLITVADIASSRTKHDEGIDKHWQPPHIHKTHIKDSDDQILNTQTLMQLEELSTSKNFLNQLAIRFNQDMDTLMDGLDQSIKNNCYKDFKNLIYALKDSSCNLGASSLYKISLQALQIRQREFQGQAKLTLKDLHEILSETKYALQHYVNKHDNSASESE